MTSSKSILNTVIFSPPTLMTLTTLLFQGRSLQDPLLGLGTAPGPPLVNFLHGSQNDPYKPTNQPYPSSAQNLPRASNHTWNKYSKALPWSTKAPCVLALAPVLCWQMFNSCSKIKHAHIHMCKFTINLTNIKDA